MVTRKCTGDFFLLTPTDLNVKNFLYILGLAQHHYPVKIHGYTFMSNHTHIVMTDPTGELGPDFIGYVNSLVARSVNSEHKLKGAVWDSTRRPNWCALTDKASEWDKLLYTLVNPVEAGLVEKHQHWPGLISSVRTLEKGKIKVHRPKGFFPEKKDKEHVKTVTLRFSALPGAESMGYEAYIRHLRRLVRQKEEEICARRARENKPFLGAQAVRDMPVFKLPVKKTSPSLAEGKGKKRCKRSGRRKDESARIKPRAAGGPESLSHWLNRYECFRSQYHAARASVLAGARNTAFPLGTYQMHVRWGFAVSAEDWVSSPMAL